MKNRQIRALLSGLVAAGWAAGAAYAADDPHLADRIEIMELLARNVQASDSKDMDEYMKTYAKNPEFYTDQQNCVGAEAVRAFGQTLNCRDAPGGSSVPGSKPYTRAAPPATDATTDAEAGAAPQRAKMRHSVCCSVIKFSDKNNATHRGYYFSVSGTNIISAGHYEDVLIREEGRWVLKSRRLAH